MELEVWLRWYAGILEDFGFDRAADEEAAEYLRGFLEEHGSIDLHGLELPSRNFIVFGAGPSLKEHAERFRGLDENLTVVSADGATTALLEEGIVPHIIVTDLDGRVEDILEASRLGSTIVVHAHGNNLEKLRRYLPLLKNLAGTTQSIPSRPLYNFGGFTDGDRAVFLAVALGAERIILAGMDFGDTITRYSRPGIKGETARADPVKKLKLEYARKLIEWIRTNRDVEIETW